MNRQRKAPPEGGALVKAKPVALVKVNPVAEQLGRDVEKLPPGVYRMQTTICRIDFDPKTGKEKKSTTVSSLAYDFESKPMAQALPPAPVADQGDEGEQGDDGEVIS